MPIFLPIIIIITEIVKVYLSATRYAKGKFSFFKILRTAMKKVLPF